MTGRANWCANSLPICELISKTPRAVGPVSLIQPHRETLILKQKWDIPDFTAVYLARIHPEFKRRKEILAQE